MLGWSTFSTDQWNAFSIDDWAGFLLDVSTDPFGVRAASFFVVGAVAAQVSA